MTLQVEVLKPAIGAKVHLDRAAIGDPAVSQELLALLEKHTVLVLPQIGLSDAEQLALTDALGERVNVEAKVPGRADAAAVYEVTLNEGAAIEREYVFGTFFWHMDGLTVDVPPPKASLLSARQLAAKGGQTEFASTKAAYAALSDDEKADLADLRVVHTVTASVREVCGPEGIDEARRALRHEHPMVWTRRDGTKSLIIGSTADQIPGMNQAEARALLARLLDWTAQPAFSYRHEWQEGDCVIWDNPSALHRVVPYAVDSGRRMHRTGIAGVETSA
ncbi:TauD/TfdA dioxygenase family protein [Novosphingobium sp. JCM 18896]|uniref:TauD/TfdA dioxygenase family protein n=1 Tax=Novosphingobium sp. JCM 18896 TaxID=2989731 RepID=UPI00222166A2|nr:TauD/TfdA family dioxygenase [Novosphingobium sp. JCM 18896]MCW1427470.1 TauD/TfdA family dioxygenase [Novosphingobium sp. JCM 18896]